jgi:hypothetical protein
VARAPTDPRERLCEEGRSQGLGGFLRSLLSGIPWSESAERVDTESLKPPRGGSLKLHNSNGKTRIVGEDREDILVTACKRARAESSEAAMRLLGEITLTRSEANGVLELDLVVPRNWKRHGSANLDVRVPRGLGVEVAASNGRVLIEGLRAAVKAHSSNGSVSVIDTVGDIVVHTSNAKVECDGTRGRLIARSSNGKIELQEHRGSVDAATSNGLIDAEIQEIGREGVTLSTSNGRIALRLPEQIDADVDLHVDNGVVRNDRSLVRATRETNGRVRGTLGKGGPMIKLRTTNGSISLR